jgi:hypothetical protein
LLEQAGLAAKKGQQSHLSPHATSIILEEYKTIIFKIIIIKITQCTVKEEAESANRTESYSQGS